MLWAAILGGMVLLLALAKYADSRGVYRAYMPLWHRILSCSDVDRYRKTGGGGGWCGCPPSP